MPRWAPLANPNRTAEATMKSMEDACQDRTRSLFSGAAQLPATQLRKREMHHRTL